MSSHGRNRGEIRLQAVGLWDFAILRSDGFESLKFLWHKSMLERRYCELRDTGDGGPARRNGDQIRGDRRYRPGLRERFVSGVFGDRRQADVTLNYQHRRSRPLARTGGGGLRLIDSPESLSVVAEMPKTRESEDALTLVRSRVLRGLSIEFSAIRERSVERVRQVEQARLVAVGLVDSPAYSGSIVQVRGRFLAEAIEAAIGQSDRAEIIASMAAAAGISASTVEQILRGEIELPPRERLAGFAEALGIDPALLIEAANQARGLSGETEKAADMVLEDVKEDDLSIMEEQSGELFTGRRKRGQGSRFSGKYGSDTGSRERRFTDHAGSIGGRCEAGKVDRGCRGTGPTRSARRSYGSKGSRGNFVFSRFCSITGRIEAASISFGVAKIRRGCNREALAKDPGRAHPVGAS